MIKDAINRVLELDKTIVKEDIGGRIYTKEKLQRLELPNELAPGALNFSSLTGIVDFFKGLTPPVEVDESNLFFHVESPTLVSLCGAIQPENFNRRFIYAVAELNHDSFQFATHGRKHWYDLEMFVIGLQSLFVRTDELDQIIDMIGSVANENVQENKDDGFSQTIQVRTGITTRDRKTIKNPVTLKPWRTFREVDQPESQFILRFAKQGDGLTASLWEADGGIWKHTAMSRVAEWLKEHAGIMAVS